MKKVDIPLGAMVGIAGVSGSGKSSLIADTLVPVLQAQLSSGAGPSGNDDTTVPLLTKSLPRYGSITGLEHICRCVSIGQEPIGRRSTSNPVSYLGIWDRIRRTVCTATCVSGTWVWSRALFV